MKISKAELNATYVLKPLAHVVIFENGRQTVLTIVDKIVRGDIVAIHTATGRILIVDINPDTFSNNTLARGFWANANMFFSW